MSEVGQYVTHPAKPEWGVGKVLRVQGDQVLVFFLDAGPHNGALKNPVELSLQYAQLKPAGIASHPHLDNLPPLDGDTVTSGEAFVTRAQGIARFRQLFPEGFSGKAYWNEERGYKWVAHQESAKLLGRKALEGLLERGDYQEIANRARKVIGMVNLLASFEIMALNDGLKAGPAQERFGPALFQFLHGESSYEQRFTQFADVLSTLPQKQAPVFKWPVQTILPFLFNPTQHMFLKPQVTRQAANRHAFDLRYDAEPNWTTYRQLLRLCQLLAEDLKDLGPKDYIDIQSFIWCIGDDNYKVLPAGDKPFKP